MLLDIEFNTDISIIKMIEKLRTVKMLTIKFFIVIWFSSEKFDQSWVNIKIIQDFKS